ncbi:APC family permease [Rhodoferax sp.]|uniref:APC family permease n=1 Tax=Rhodoferax sp. TaxID=50421 RepID=UPI0028412F29|nr:APC family permease [Rhodoferax sp.]MDR3371856.1 APC family permease [Rhodoferax sp.]
MNQRNTSSGISHAAHDPSESLRAGKLGVTEIVFFVVAAAAPLVGMTGALPPSIALGSGAAAPGAYLVVGLTLLLFSVGYAAMSHQVTNAGAFFAYIGRGLGSNFGVGSALVSILAYLTIQLSIYGFLGGLIAGQVGILPWWGWTTVAWVLVTLLSLCQVDVGAKILGLLMLLELLSLLVTSVAILSNGGPEGLQFAASFSPAAIFAGGLTGSAGIALAFAFASFIGFEATAIYGEESKNPKKTVPLATYLSVCVITLLFALTSFSVVTGLGASKVVEKTLELTTVDKVPLTEPAAVLFHLAKQYVGAWMATAMSILVMSSLFAGLLAFQNSASRYFFALSRGGELPHALSKVNRFGAPGHAALLTSVIAGLVILVFAMAGLDPVLNMFFWFSGVAVVAILLIEILVCFAVVAFFHRHPGEEGVFTAKVAPMLAVTGLVLGQYLLMSRFGLLSGAVAEGVDPTTTQWGLSGLGWSLVLLPFLVFMLGFLYSSLVHKPNRELVDDEMVYE